MLKVTDNLLTPIEQTFIENLLKYSKNWQFLYHQDYAGTMLAISVMRLGRVHNDLLIAPLEQLLVRYLGAEFPGKNYDLHKVVVNGQYTQNKTFWHTDIDREPTDLNLIYYVNTDWDSDIDGGEFQTREDIVEVKTGRFVCFPCGVEHVGNAPKSDKFRMSIGWTFKLL
jgi:hypothetical protein